MKSLVPKFTPISNSDNVKEPSDELTPTSNSDTVNEEPSDEQHSPTVCDSIELTKS